MSNCEDCLRWEPEPSGLRGRCSLLMINTGRLGTCGRWQLKLLCLMHIGVGGVDHRRHFGNPSRIGETLCGLKYKINRPHGDEVCKHCETVAASIRRGIDQGGGVL